MTKNSQIKSASGEAQSAEPLAESERDAAIAFLAQRPLHTVIMAGWLRDYGVVNPQHRGTFFRTVDRDSQLTGVALIGRNTFFEARSKASLKSLAVRAREHSEIKMVFGETNSLTEFCSHYVSPDSDCPPLQGELLFAIHVPPGEENVGCELHAATTKDLDSVVRAHAAMVLDETGIDPLFSDPDGFRSRCASRVDRGRVWVHTHDGKLVFKTDVLSETPDAIYIEGLWVNPEFRGRSIASRCMTSFCRNFLDGSNSICAFVDAGSKVAQGLYLKAGFSVLDRYEKLYL